MEIAREKGLDLVEVQPNAVPPVCRLMDYGRFRYEESRRERESRKKAKGAILKEVRMAPKIDDHDLQTKARQAQRFLESGDKVKVSVLFRGREMLHQDIGRRLLIQMIQQLEGTGTVEQDPRMEGRSMSIILAPKPGLVAARAAQQAQAQQQREEAQGGVTPTSVPADESDQAESAVPVAREQETVPGGTE